MLESHAKSFCPVRVVINRSKTGVGRFHRGDVVQLHLAFGTSSVANTTAGSDLVQGPSSLRLEKMDNARNPIFQVSPSSWLWPSCIRERRRLQFQIKNVNLYQARDFGPNIDHAMNVVTLSECRSRGKWRTDKSVKRYQQSARLAADYLALRRRTRKLIETFAPHAEGAILGTSQSFACTGV